MPTNRVKTAFIIMSSVALALAVITFVVVFYPIGSYQPVTKKTAGPAPAASSTISSSTSGTSNAFVTIPTLPASQSGFASEYSYPYPVNWNEEREQISITGASLQDSRLTLTLAVKMGNASECVPLNLRLITDETGTQRAPDSPLNSIFVFPDTESCIGNAGATYSQSVVFPVDAVTAPFVFTTGGASNIFFQVATTTAGGVQITLPSNSG